MEPQQPEGGRGVKQEVGSALRSSRQSVQHTPALVSAAAVHVRCRLWPCKLLCTSQVPAGWQLSRGLRRYQSCHGLWTPGPLWSQTTCSSATRSAAHLPQHLRHPTGCADWPLALHSLRHCSLPLAGAPGARRQRQVRVHAEHDAHALERTCACDTPGRRQAGRRLAVRRGSDYQLPASYLQPPDRRAQQAGRGAPSQVQSTGASWLSLCSWSELTLGGGWWKQLLKQLAYTASLLIAGRLMLLPVTHRGCSSLAWQR